MSNERAGTVPNVVRSGLRGMALFWLAISLILTLWPVRGASAQAPPLKGIASGIGACAGITPVPASPSPAASSRALVDSLVTAGGQAAILGELEAARLAYEVAAEVDPTNPVIAYRLARTLDDQDRREEAVTQYCRFHALDPIDAEAREVPHRILELTVGTVFDAWSSAFEEGLRAHVAGRYQDAVRSFSRAIELRPDDPIAFYNRAAAFRLGGHLDFAANDLEMYLSLAPGAEDRVDVAREIQALRFAATGDPLSAPRGVSPGLTLGLGLVVPGMGQFITGRSALGSAVLAAAAGSVYLGTRQQIVSRREGAYDPFGNYYEYEVLAVDRPHRTLGYGVAAAIAVIGAVEGYLYASQRAEVSRLTLTRGASADGSRSTHSCRLPTASAPGALPPALLRRSANENCRTFPETERMPALHPPVSAPYRSTTTAPTRS